jgi:hypothetical protein
VTGVQKHDKKISPKKMTNPGTFLASEEPTNHVGARHFVFECPFALRSPRWAGGWVGGWFRSPKRTRRARSCFRLLFLFFSPRFFFFLMVFLNSPYRETPNAQSTCRV